MLTGVISAAADLEYVAESVKHTWCEAIFVFASAVHTQAKLTIQTTA